MIDSSIHIGLIVVLIYLNWYTKNITVQDIENIWGGGRAKNKSRDLFQHQCKKKGII